MLELFYGVQTGAQFSSVIKIEVNKKWQAVRCIRQLAPIAVKNAKFRSNQMEHAQYTAAIVIRNVDPSATGTKRMDLK
jgi:hypothetical protein